MNLRHKRRNSQLGSMEPNFKPLVGLLNTVATLNCRIQSSDHHFNISFIHPLEFLNKIINRTKKQAFDMIVSTTFDIKISQKVTFLPSALLTGNYNGIQQYKKMIERSRIGSYIKLNLKHQEKSYEKKKLCSLDMRLEDKQNNREQNSISSRVLNQKTVNQKSNMDLKNYFSLSSSQQVQSSHKITLTQQKQKRSFAISSTENRKFKQENRKFFMSKEQRSQINIVNRTQVNFVKKASSIKKSKGMDKIKINYIAVKSSQQNPQTSTFIYKSSVQKTNRHLSQFDAKTDISSPYIIHFDKTLDNDISFSVNNDKLSKYSQFKDLADNLSQHVEKSVKNSQTSQMTHNEMYSNDYFAVDQRILKKGRKSVFVENFERKETH